MTDPDFNERLSQCVFHKNIVQLFTIFAVKTAHWIENRVDLSCWLINNYFFLSDHDKPGMESYC